MQAFEACQVRMACPHLAPTDLPWQLCGWGKGGGGRSPAVGPAPVHACASPGWRLQFAARLPAARRACMGRATEMTDDALRARVPLAPLCPASVVVSSGLRLTNAFPHSGAMSGRPLFDMNAGPTPTRRPTPSAINATEMCADPRRERRRAAPSKIAKMCAARPALHLPRRVLHLPTPKPPPPQRLGSAQHLAAPTAYCPGRPTSSPGPEYLGDLISPRGICLQRSRISLISSLIS